MWKIFTENTKNLATLDSSFDPKKEILKESKQIKEYVFLADRQTNRQNVKEKDAHKLDKSFQNRIIHLFKWQPRNQVDNGWTF